MSNIYANKTLSGMLTRDGEYSLFTYAPDATGQEAVAIGMRPDLLRQYKGTRPHTLLPAFAMNLPEGRLRESLINSFIRQLPAMDDMALFEIVGRSQIGRIRVASSPDELEGIPTLSLPDLLKTKGTGEMLNRLLDRYAQYSGVAGVQPKFLVRDQVTLGKISPDKKLAVPGTTHIVKFFDPREFPALASNEYACLTAAKTAGIQVPNFQLSEDAQSIAIERFDLKPDGTYAGVEDTCSLAGFQPGDKYTGSYEQLAKTLSAIIAPEYRGEDMAAFFQSLVLSIIVRNGDAHRKNFSVIYNTPDDARLSPAYDIISTLPYLPNDTMALMLNGSKRWPTRRTLLQFATNSCNIEAKKAGEIMDRTREAVAQTRETLVTMIKSEESTHASHALAAIINIWEDGINQTRPNPS